MITVSQTLGKLLGARPCFFTECTCQYYRNGLCYDKRPFNSCGHYGKSEIGGKHHALVSKARIKLWRQLKNLKVEVTVR